LEKCGKPRKFEDLFKKIHLFLAPTEFSATAPLKIAAKKFNFRAATMPGFSPRMIPALKIDYNEVSRRVQLMKGKLDEAEKADVHFLVDSKKEYHVQFDLRFRKAHASSGRFPEKGTAGNLPSGEAYIVPYEGEKGEKSRTEGTLPVQIKKDIVLFPIEENRAQSAEGKGINAEIENDHLKREPAYGNMAELGFGVLADFGLQPIGEILLDEKLGFHIAFGRSEHFGGIIGPEDFSSPEEVIHLDRIYIPATQPKISIQSIILTNKNNQTEMIMKKGKYLIF
jgi:leucyl aminopeptidase (aminopeptidase T)